MSIRHKTNAEHKATEHNGTRVHTTYVVRCSAGANGLRCPIHNAAQDGLQHQLMHTVQISRTIHDHCYYIYSCREILGRMLFECTVPWPACRIFLVPQGSDRPPTASLCFRGDCSAQAVHSSLPSLSPPG